jgi:putative MATE family efflux protein
MTGSMAVFAPATFNYILRGEGNTFLPMVTMFVGAITNIILDPLLIFGIWIFPEMGIQGAAAATIIARTLGGIFITFVLFSDKNEIKFNFKLFKFDFQILKDIYKVGIPAMVNRLMMSFAMIIINRILGMYNTTAIGVMGVVFRLQSFYLMAVFGLNQGYLPLLGYNYGYKKPDRMKRTVLLGWLTALTFGIIGFTVFQVFTEPLLRMFNSNPEFIEIGIPAFRKVSISYMFMALNVIGAGTFQALGRGSPSLVITFLRQALILLPSMYFLGQIGGLNSTWFAFPIAESIAFVVNIIWIIILLKKCMKTMKYENMQKEYIN